jgi:glucan phosphorylase
VYSTVGGLKAINPAQDGHLSEERSYDNQQFQDELDAENIYNIFENEIVPAFYDRNENGVPEKWVSHVKKDHCRDCS